MEKPTLPVVGAAIVRGDRCLIAQRKDEGSFPRMWEFPGGKVERGESHETALSREIHEELGIAIKVHHHAGRGECESQHHHIVLDVYFSEVLEGTPVANEHLALAWVGAAELLGYEYAPADIPILDAVRARLLATDPGAL